MDTIKHLEAKFSIASYALIKVCEPLELKFYLWLKLWAINKHSAFPSLDTISKELGYSRRQVIRLIKHMETVGRLKIKRQDGRSNIYDITYYDKLVTRMSPPRDKSVTGSSDKSVTLTNRNKRIENNYIAKAQNLRPTNPSSVSQSLDKVRSQLRQKGVRV